MNFNDNDDFIMLSGEEITPEIIEELEANGYKLFVFYQADEDDEDTSFLN